MFCIIKTQATKLNTLFFIFFILSSFQASTQSLYSIPDNGFRRCLQDWVPQYFVDDSLIIDSTVVSPLQRGLSANLQSAYNNGIDCNSAYRLLSMDGLQWFTRIDTLGLYLFGEQDFSELSGLDSLKSLSLDGPGIRSYPSLTNNHKLQSIYLYGEEKHHSELDTVPTYNHLTNLENLSIGPWVKYFPSQDSLNKLGSLWLCCQTQNIDLSGYPNLESVSIVGSYLAFNSSSGESIERYPDNIGELRSIDLSSNPNLSALNLRYNQLEHLSLTHNNRLKRIQVEHNQLASLDLPTFLDSLQILVAHQNDLSTIASLENACNLRGLYLNSNRLKEMPKLCDDSRSLSIIQLENNELKNLSLPSPLSFDWLHWFSIEENKLDFSDAQDIMRMDSFFHSKIINPPFYREDQLHFTYSPQKPFGEQKTHAFPQYIDTFITIKDQGSYATHYQWFKDGRAIPGANDTILNFSCVQLSDAGVYTCKSYGDILEDLNFGPGISEFVSEPQTVSIQPSDNEKPKVTVFPVPAREQITFDYYTTHWQRAVRIDIWDLHGKLHTRVVYQHLRGRHQVTIEDINTRLPASGIYFFKIFEEEKILGEGRFTILR